MKEIDQCKMMKLNGVKFPLMWTQIWKWWLFNVSWGHTEDLIKHVLELDAGRGNFSSDIKETDCEQQHRSHKLRSLFYLPAQLRLESFIIASWQTGQDIARTHQNSLAARLSSNAYVTLSCTGSTYISVVGKISNASRSSCLLHPLSEYVLNGAWKWNCYLCSYLCKCISHYALLGTSGGFAFHRTSG